MSGKTKKISYRGTLPILAGMLILSGLLRTGGGVGAALALETAASEPAEAAAEPAPQEEYAAVIAALKTREERLLRREAQIEDRLQVLKVAEERFQSRLIELKSAEETLAATIARAKTASEDDVQRLTAMYETMKPKDAAILFEEMAPKFSAGFLARMKPQSAAAILAGLTPQKAYSISVILAGRNAETPTQ